MVKSKIILLIVIIVLAGFLRLWQLGTIPVSLTWDEVAWAYNAYSIGIDGKDEFGVFLPHFYLESFGDFKPPLYTYLSVIPVWLFGMTAFAVRFASAFLGTLTVLLTYFLVKRIFITSTKREWYSVGAAFFLAISPWHIMLSRGAWEENIVTFLLVLGTWLFLKGVQENKVYIPMSAFTFALAPYTFNSGRIVMPLLVLVLGIGFYKMLWKHWKITLVSCVIAVAMLGPYVPHLLSPQASLRFSEVTYFSDISVAERFNEQVLRDGNPLWSRLIHHRYLIYTTMFLRHYFDHLNPVTLFSMGDDNPKFSLPNIGLMYLWSAPFFVLGLLFLIRKKEGNWWLIPSWILVGIVPAAVAWDTPHALRIGTTAPVFNTILAYGAVTFYFWLRRLSVRPSIKNGVVVCLFLGLLLNSMLFFHTYFFNYNREHASLWQDSYKEIIAFTEKRKNNYDEIRMSRNLGRPYIYVAYYTKIDPDSLRNSIELYRESFGFVKVTKLGKYHFTSVQDHTKTQGKHILYISEPEQVPAKAKILKDFYSADGTRTMEAYEI